MDSYAEVVFALDGHGDLLLVADALPEELSIAFGLDEDVDVFGLLGEEWAIAVIDQSNELQSDLAGSIGARRHGDVTRVHSECNGDETIRWFGFG